MMNLTDSEFQASLASTEQLLADTDFLLADIDSFLANLNHDALIFQRKQIEAAL